MTKSARTKGECIKKDFQMAESCREYLKRYFGFVSALFLPTVFKTADKG